MAEDSFDDDTSAKALRYVKQLSEWHHRILVVSGAGGAGRAALFQLLSNHVEPGSRAARVNGAAQRTGHDMWAAVAFGLGIEVRETASQSDLQGKILAHSRDLADVGRLDIILMDNADHLPDSVIESFLELMEKSLAFDGLRLVLFGDENFGEGFGLMIAAFAPEVGWHHTPLNPDTVDATERYLKRRLARSPGAQSRLDIDLGELETTGASPSRRGLPWIHIAVASVISLVLLVVLVDFQSLLPDRVERGGDIPTPLEALKARENARREVSTPREIPVVRVPPSEVRPIEATPVELMPAVLMPPPGPESESVAAKPSGVEAAPVSMPGTWMDDVADDTESAEEPSPDTVNVAPQVAPVVEVLEAPESRGVPEQPAEPIVEAAEQSMARLEAESEPEPAPRPEKEAPSTAAETVPQARGPDWIREQHPEAYVLQLFGVSSRERLDRFLDAQAPKEPFAYFEMRRGGSPWFVVLYGVYPDRESASNGANELPSSVGGSPWIRSFGEVQKDVEGSR